VLPFEDRFSRQRCLPEVGESGQRRLSRARCTVYTDVSGRIEADYLERAGMQIEYAPATSPRDRQDPRLDFFTNAAASDLARGSWNALTRVRRELGLTP